MRTIFDDSFYVNLNPYEIHKTPFYTDHCNHGKNCYIGSADFFAQENKKYKIDFYIFKWTVNEKYHVCIREGEQPSECRDLGDIFECLTRNNINADFYGPVIQMLIKLIQENTTFIIFPDF